MSAIDTVLARLRGGLGTGETPRNSNNNFIVEWYNDNVERIGRGPWCQMTVTWSHFTSLTTRLIKGRAYTVWAAQDFEQHYLGGTWHWGTAGMRAGDIVYYDWTGRKGNVALVDHVGTVERIIGNGTFYVLEGNNNANRLDRMLRDSKYVVGYGRPDWSRIPAPPASSIPNLPKPKPPVGFKVDRVKTRAFQGQLEFAPARRDGLWGNATDARALLMRAAARGGKGSMVLVQKIVDVTPDGARGPKTNAAIKRWVSALQSLLGVKADGDWGPKTDAAFLAFRKANLNRF